MSERIPIVTTDNIDFHIHYNGKEILDIENIAFSNESGDISKIKIPKSVSRIFFMNEFDQDITNDLFSDNRIRCLIFGNIKTKLTMESVSNIPVFRLVLLNGFSQPLTQNILPKKLQELALHNIETVLTKESFPIGLRALELNNGFNQLITDGILPVGLDQISIGDINYRISIGVLPISLRYFYITDSYKYVIEKGVVPPKVKVFHIHGNISEPLIVGSIPNGVIELEIGKDCIVPFEKDVIPPSCAVVVLDSINLPITKDTFPKTVLMLRLDEPLLKSTEFVSNLIQLGVKSYVITKK